MCAYDHDYVAAAAKACQNMSALIHADHVLHDDGGCLPREAAAVGAAQNWASLLTTSYDYLFEGGSNY
jgi:hypothetical protein